MPGLAAVLTAAAVWSGLRPWLDQRGSSARVLGRWRQGLPAARAKRSLWLAAAAVFGVALGLAGLGWWQTPALLAAAHLGAGLAAQWASQQAETALAQSLPMVWQLFAACHEAGLGLRQSVPAVAGAMSGEAGRRLRQVQAALDAGQRADAAGGGTGEEDAFLRGWRLLVRAETAGSPVAPLLKRLSGQSAAELRWQRRTALARLPLWLTLVTVICFLPGVLAVTVLPQVLGFIAQMR